MAVQGHPRSLILAPIESAYATFYYSSIHRGAWSDKKQDTKLLFITLPNNDRFSKFFHCYTQREICNTDVITHAKP